MDYEVLNRRIDGIAYSQLPPSVVNALEEVDKKMQLIQDGLPIDWLMRAQKVRNIETMVYLSDLQEEWAHEDISAIAGVLQDHQASIGCLLRENEPTPFSRRRSNEDSWEVVKFVSRFMDLLQKETVIWDRIGDPNFGYHRPMRQAWCSISVKLGGWGEMQHVQMLKSIYRRKRDQYNIEVVRNQGNRPFQYERQMEFLRPVLELANSTGTTSAEIDIDTYMKEACPGMDVEHEICSAPENVQNVIRNYESLMEEVKEKFGEVALSEFMSICCEDIVAQREQSAVEGLADDEWMNVPETGYEEYEEENESPESSRCSLLSSPLRDYYYQDPSPSSDSTDKYSS